MKMEHQAKDWRQAVQSLADPPHRRIIGVGILAPFTIVMHSAPKKQRLQQALELWTRQMLEQHQHDDICLKNIQNMQRSADTWLQV